MKLRLDPNNFDSCPRYNDWIDERHVQEAGTLKILGFEPRPSAVLHALSQETYQTTFDDFRREHEEALVQAVCEEFPSPIAHYFYRFHNGYESELQRLHFLRDTWEALIDILHAITLAECRLKQIQLTKFLNFSELLSDKVAQRLLNIERVLNLAVDQGLQLWVKEIVSSKALEARRELNRTRNAFSHSAAQSELQASSIIGECIEDVMDILDELRRLENVKLLRYLGHVDQLTLRCELFKGHGFAKTIRKVSITSDQSRDSQRYFGKDQILLQGDGLILPLRPLVHYREDPSGHTTKLCLFRKMLPEKVVEFEIVGEGSRHNEQRALFKGEFDDIRSLFGLSPD